MLIYRYNRHRAGAKQKQTHRRGNQTDGYRRGSVMGAKPGLCN